MYNFGETFASDNRLIRYNTKWINIETLETIIRLTVSSLGNNGLLHVVTTSRVNRRGTNNSLRLRGILRRPFGTERVNSRYYRNYYRGYCRGNEDARPLLASNNDTFSGTKKGVACYNSFRKLFSTSVIATDEYCGHRGFLEKKSSVYTYRMILTNISRSIVARRSCSQTLRTRVRKTNGGR